MTKPWVSSEVAAVNPTWTVRDDGYYFIEEAPNVLELRTLKMRHFLGLADVVPNIAMIRYEDLAADQAVLARIAETFSIRLSDGPLKNVDTYLRGSGQKSLEGGRTYDPISDADLDHINRHLDWDVESVAGYSPSDYRG